MEKNLIKVGILGFGNLGKGLLDNLIQDDDFNVVGIFTKRNPQTIKNNCDVPVFPSKVLPDFKDKIDVLFLCGGSYNGLQENAYEFSKSFCTIDAFDTHKKAKEYYSNVNRFSKDNQKTSLVCCGWDPGILSLIRLLFSSIGNNTTVETFWGKGVSQGHTNAIKSLDNVIDALQFTIPRKKFVSRAKKGKKIGNALDKHVRKCFVVVRKKKLKKQTADEIKNIEDYFYGYKTVVSFVSQKKLDKLKRIKGHKGRVISTGNVGEKENFYFDLRLNMTSNPSFTGAILMKYAKAIYKMNREKDYGAKTVFDVPLSYLTDEKKENLIEKYL